MLQGSDSAAESEGLSGLRAYSQILKMIRSNGHIAIVDIKRGDIGSTAEMYAKGHFEGDFEADILTLNAYMGEDAVKPYAKYFREKTKAHSYLQKLQIQAQETPGPEGRRGSSVFKGA